MYIQRLNNYNDEDWSLLLSHVEIEHQDRVRQVLTMPTKQGIEENFSFLARVGIINGIGAAWMDKNMRKCLTKLCPTVRFEWHDIEYFIGGNIEDQDRADINLFKYSILSVVENFSSIAHLKVNPIVMFLLLSIIFAISILQFILIGIFWMLLYFFGNKAFRFTDK